MEQQMSQTTRSDVLPTILSLSDVSDEPKYSKSKIAILPVSDDSEQRLWDRVATSLANVAVSSTSTRSDPAIGDIGVIAIAAGARLDIQHGDAFIRFSNADSPDSTTIKMLASSPVNELMPPLDAETEDMCRRNGLLPYIPQIDKIIRATHRGVEAITLERTERFGDGEYEMLCFTIRLKGKTTEVAAARKKLRTTIYDSIPRDKRQFLRFTYHII